MKEFVSSTRKGGSKWSSLLSEEDQRPRRTVLRVQGAPHLLQAIIRLQMHSTKSGTEEYTKRYIRGLRGQN